MNAAVHPFALLPFGTSSVALGLELRGQLEREGDQLQVHYGLSGDLASVVVPPPAAGGPHRADGLWEHTCFELFLAAEGSECYWEVNLAPNGNWNLYRLEGYRRGLAREADREALPFAVQHGPQELQLTLTLPLPQELAEACRHPAPAARGHRSDRAAGGRPELLGPGPRGVGGGFSSAGGFSAAAPAGVSGTPTLDGMISIRDATEEDLPRILAIYNASIPAGRSTADTRPITVEQRRTWFATFDPERRPIWVAEQDGQVVGCVYLTSFYGGRPAYDRTAEISLYIAPEHQRQGIGTLLLQRMKEACPRLGVDTLISMYFDHNPATQRLNDRFGFEVAGHLPEIADVFGQKRGLKIALLRIPPVSR